MHTITLKKKVRIKQDFSFNFSHYYPLIILIFCLFLFGNTLALSKLPINFSFQYFTFQTFRHINTDKDSIKTLFFGIITTNNPQRQQFTNVTWFSKIHDFHYKGKFISDDCLSSQFKDSCIMPTKEFTDLQNFGNTMILPNTNRAMKRIYGLEYFLNFTTADFYWSLTDDVGVDLISVSRIMEKSDWNSILNF